LLQHFCNILLLSFFSFSACARDYNDFLHRNTLSHISFWRCCVLVYASGWGLQCSSSLEHQITHSVF
jgi:hypothetical protein